MEITQILASECLPLYDLSASVNLKET